MSMRLPRAAVARVPEGTRIVSVERMSRAFTKYHLDDGRALHRFKMEEPHATPHDHPWGFETEVLEGGYVDEVFHLDSGGGWHSELVHRVPGERYMSTLRIFTALSSCRQANAGRWFVPDPTHARPGSGGSGTQFSRVPGTSGNGRITSDERGNAEVLTHASHAAIAASPERQEQIATGGFIIGKLPGVISCLRMS
ncbi:hypothetical protein [Sphingomonas faeni]|uniref:hypothetical protein n=1 Tax=Sphingomonas faeni TaxID=185950 RepID=UPI00277DA30B|nr:hypothetical protein [Sphingomonas faeni]MDQ0840089.1 hypothetical protein [Sphingomonas faeni]